MQATSRYVSIDVLRGWAVAGMLLVNNAGDWNHVLPWLEHAAWHGFTPADLIFPLFLFIVGLSLELSFAHQLALGVSPSSLQRDAVKRGMRLFLLGVALHVFAQLTIEGRAFRLMGVLQRIGIAFALAGCLIALVRTQGSRWVALLLLLAIHGSLLFYGGSLEPHQNVSDRIDAWALGAWAYTFDPGSGLAQEPEGLLSTMGALASVLTGVQAATMLRSGRLHHLFALAVVCLLSGWALSSFMPLNKQMWTPTFVLWTSGWACLLFLCIHGAVDRKGLPAWGRSFGINAITAYAGSWVATCLLAMTGAGDWIYQRVFSPRLEPLLGGDWTSAAFAAMFTSVFGLLTFWMARRNLRIVI